MANSTCVGVVQTNILRVTRLTGPAGYLDAGASNLYITDSVIEIQDTPVYAPDTDLEQPNGGGEICVSYTRDGDYKRHDLTTSLCKYDAELLELLTSATLITSGGNTIGSKFGTDTNTGWACVEAFQTVVEDGSPTGEYLCTVWPKTQWKRGATNRSNTIQTYPLTGKAFINRNVGLGPAGDWPIVADEPGTEFIVTSLPVAQCGYASAAIGS